MKRVLFVLFTLLLTSTVHASEESVILEHSSINKRINNVGAKILNANKLEKRVVFVYSEEEKATLLKSTKTLTKREVVVYKGFYERVETEDELAAYIAREIPAAIRSYDGVAKGWLSSVKIKAAPKKYELVFDKFAVDYMVKAGYNPLGLITFINKTCPQTRQDRFSSKNLTSKRLAYVYEYIYMKYPSFLANNTYIKNEYYQNFLLTSQENRRLLKEKIEKKDWKAKIDYK